MKPVRAKSVVAVVVAAMVEYKVIGEAMAEDNAIGEAMAEDNAIGEAMAEDNAIGEAMAEDNAIERAMAEDKDTTEMRFVRRWFVAALWTATLLRTIESWFQSGRM
jgi:hypothetical protein